MSFVLQHYPFTKPQLLEIHTSLLPPSNDSLKMNAQKTDPPRSCLSLANRGNIYFGTCWFANTKGLRSTCHYPPPPRLFSSLPLIWIFLVGFCVYRSASVHRLYKPLLSNWFSGPAAHQALVQYHVGWLSHGGQMPSLWPHPQRGGGTSLLPGTVQITFIKTPAN